MKNSFNKYLFVAVILLALVNITLLILIFSGKGLHNSQHPQNNGGLYETIVHELNLNERQKNDYQKLRDEYLTNVRPMFDSMHEIRKQFFQLIQGIEVSDSAFDNYIRRIGERQAIIDKLRFEHFRKVRGILSGEQQKKFDDLMQKMLQQRINGPGRRDSVSRH